MNTKICGICYIEKNISEYRQNKHTINNKIYINTDSYCKDCRRMYDKERRRIQRARLKDLQGKEGGEE